MTLNITFPARFDEPAPGEFAASDALTEAERWNVQLGQFMEGIQAAEEGRQVFDHEPAARRQGFAAWQAADEEARWLAPFAGRDYADMPSGVLAGR